MLAAASFMNGGFRLKKSLFLVPIILIALLALGCQSGSSWLAKRMQGSGQQSQLEKNRKTASDLQAGYAPKKSSTKYLEGYDAGYYSGFGQGRQDGSNVQPYTPTLKSISSGNIEYDQGYIEGYSDGYDSGFCEGTLAAAGTAEPSTPTQPEASDTGDYDAGHEAGFKVGYTQGKNDWVKGYGYYDYSPDSATVEEQTSGRSDLYEQGWREGYKDGYVQAWQEQEGG